jgi:LysM repeat protein
LEVETNEVKQTHKVEKGDTIYSIARRYGVSVESIIELNKLRDFTISLGQILKIH